MTTTEPMTSSRRFTPEETEDEISKSAISQVQAKEQEIEKKKLEIKEKVQLHLGKAEEETKRLTQIWEELEELADPTRKEVATVRKRIDVVNKELKSLGQNCQKKEKEYKDAVEGLNEKNKEKTQLVSTLMELLAESEKLRMSKLEKLNKHMELLE